MANRKDGLLQMRMLGIEEESPRPSRIDDIGFFDGHEVRMVHIDGVTWWMAADVCMALDVDNVSKALARLEDDEKGITTGDTPGGKQEVLIVNEPGLYSLIFTSRKEKSKRFKRWVLHEVLPAIRKYGFYTAGPRHARTMRRLKCDPVTAESRHQITGGYKAFCRSLAANGFKAPTHYAMATNRIYAAVFASDAKGMRKRVGARPRSPLFDHMSRLALDVQRLVISVLEQELRERAEAGESGEVADQIEFLRARAGEIIAQILTVRGPLAALDVVDDPQRGRLYDVIQKQIGGPN